MNKSLFNTFEPVSAKAWKQKIQFDLKGADYNDTLVWQSLEGIHVKPYYHADDFDASFAAIPGQPRSWRVAQAIFIADEAIANRLAVDAASRGAEALIFTSETTFDPSKVFQKIDFRTITIYLELQFLEPSFVKQLKHYFQLKKATVYYNIDLVGNLARSGNWFHNLKEDHTLLEEILSEGKQDNILSIDTSLYQNAGANCVQQLAYALAHANEYLNHLDTVKINAQEVSFKVSIGSNYFFEIAKIRALRKLYAAIAKAYGLAETCHITAIPSKRNKTIYDYNVNMLRTTTECMSAILGGADTICNLPYDALYHKSNEFGERISRNQLLILKAESYFDATNNAADGAYYIEALTKELAEKALDLFKNIEAGGGFLKQLKAGTIQRKIKESAEKEQALFDSGKLVLLGTNKHPNASDTMKNDLELYPFVKHKPRKTLLPPIVERRLSEKIEQERLTQE